MKKLLMALFVSVLALITLFGCAKEPIRTANVEVMDGLELEVIDNKTTTKVFYVIVKFETDPIDTDRLFKVKVPVKNRFLDVNNYFNYPIGTILNVKETDLEPYVKVVPKE